MSNRYMRWTFSIVSVFADTYTIENCVCQWNLTTEDIASQACSRNKPRDRTFVWDWEHSARYAQQIWLSHKK